MATIETDYLVVGAGASGLAFVDALVAGSDVDVDVVLVDRRHRPGGHWLDAYPFVRLHQPSANYGVSSRALGNDRIDDTGQNVGFYERATAAEICAYFGSVLDDDLVPTGRVRFFGMTDHRGVDHDGHHLVSLLTGEEITVKVRGSVVDATYVESSIPSRHTPGFVVDDGVRLLPPNDLVDLDAPASTFVVLGGGKTAMDTCVWLLDQGVDPDGIEWYRPRDSWLFDRASMQPRDLVGSYMHLQGSWVEAAALAYDSREFARHLEADGIFTRIDPATEPGVFRGAIISAREIDALRTIERVVRGRVQRVGRDRVTTELGDVAAADDPVYVDCTAAGVRPTKTFPIFEPGRITLQLVTIGFVPWSAATIGVVEACNDNDAAKNALCPPLTFTGEAADLLHLAHAGMLGSLARGSDPAVSAWNEHTRLNPARGADEHLDDPRVPAAFAAIRTHLGAALANLERQAGAAFAGG